MVVSSDSESEDPGSSPGPAAKFQNSFFHQNAERRKATRQGFPPEFAKGF